MRTAHGQTADGTPVDLCTLTNPGAMRVGITNYGGIVTPVLVLKPRERYTQTTVYRFSTTPD